jgi:hypothetical protein
MKRFPEPRQPTQRPQPPQRAVHAKGSSQRKGLICIVLLASIIGAHASAQSASCEALLTIELTPDVPNPSDVGFLNSLLSNKVRYQLTLQRERSDSLIEVELAGPGPDYRCQNVIEVIRRDGRVRSVQVTVRS